MRKYKPYSNPKKGEKKGNANQEMASKTINNIQRPSFKFQNFYAFGLLSSKSTFNRFSSFIPYQNSPPFILALIPLLLTLLYLTSPSSAAMCNKQALETPTTSFVGPTGYLKIS